MGGALASRHSTAEETEGEVEVEQINTIPAAADAPAPRLVGK